MTFTRMTLNGQTTSFENESGEQKEVLKKILGTKITDYLSRSQLINLRQKKFQTHHGLLDFFQKCDYTPGDVQGVRHGQIQMKDRNTIAFSYPKGYILIPPYSPNEISDINSPGEALVPESVPEPSRESILESLGLMEVSRRLASVLGRGK